MRKIPKYLLSLIFGACLISFKASASDPNLEEVNIRLNAFVDKGGKAHFPALIHSLKELSEDSIKKLDQKNLERATTKVMNSLPSCFCILEDLNCISNPNFYRNILLYMSYVRHVFQEESPLLNVGEPKHVLKAACNLYYRQGIMDEEMVKAFSTLNQHYQLELDCMTLYEIWSELSIEQKLFGGIIWGPIFGVYKVIATPAYRNVVVGILGASIAIRYLI